MECPKCGSSKSSVNNSRKIELAVFRTRVCKDCGYKFYTEEMVLDPETEIDSIRSYIKEQKRIYRENRKRYLERRKTNEIVDR